MNTGIRIIKRGALEKQNSLPVNHAEKTEQQRERETASTIQAWIAEWGERKRSLRISTFALINGDRYARHTQTSAI